MDTPEFGSSDWATECLTIVNRMDALGVSWIVIDELCTHIANNTKPPVEIAWVENVDGPRFQFVRQSEASNV